MIILTLFAFIAGLVTILSPCILPILPIVLSSGVNKQGTKPSLARPLGTVLGFVLSFTFFTLFLSSIVRVLGIPSDSLRIFSVIVISFFGLTLLIPFLQNLTERLFSKISRFSPTVSSNPSFWSGIVLGITLGLLWTPCVGPILASVIALAISGTVTLSAFFITLAFSIGTAIPMLLIIRGGSQLLHRVPWLTKNTEKIQKVFGVIMILTAISIYFNLDRRFQTYIITKFPLYGAGLTKIEDIALVKERLNIVGQTNKIMVAPELIPGGDWFNSTPLTIQGLRGKVVLVDFWTYTCINCIRTLPYLHDWYEKYADNGLVIIGVHSPEFEFEKNPDNLAQAIIDFDIKYPVVQDNNFSTWRAYNNNYWPAKYLIDKDGDIRYTHFGEGEYDKTEQIIQELISEISGQKPEDQIANVIYSNEARTPEIYLGYGRGDSFASRDEEKIQSFKFPSSLSPNQVAFSGSWFVGREYIGAQIGSSLKLDFNAKDVFLVMRSTDKPVKISVYVDDVKQYFGKDNQDGEVTIDVDRLYHLITIPQAGRHILRLEFMEGGVEAYAFTFG